MKTKLFVSLLLLTAAVAPRALAAADGGGRNLHTGRGQLLVTPVYDPAVKDVPPNPAAVPSDPRQVLQDYDSLMIALTQKFSATLATIAEAVKRGEVSSEQAREMSAEQYQLTHMQFQLLSLWRGIEEQDLARIPDVEAKPDSTQGNEVVMVALPFSSFQTNPSLATYLSLTPSQVEAIQRVMMEEQHSLEPLMTQLRTTGERLLAIGSEHLNAKQVTALADAQASLLARLIVANARMQSKIYKISAPSSRKSSAISSERRVRSHRMLGKGAITVKHRLEAARVTADADAEMVVPHRLGLTRKTTTVQATARSLPISVLDLVPTRPGEPAGGAIARSVELARHVERLGYKRYWLAEHHAIQGLACSATPVLIGHIAAATKTIRVGSGGVMLPNHAPLVVAEQFGTLEAIYPGRIDLGLGRAPGGDFQTMRALRRGLAQDGDDFPALLEELRTYLGPERPGQLVKAIPGQNSNVPITLLGSSDFSAQLAAALGLPFAFAAHFAPYALDAAAKYYRERFQPSEVLPNPYLLVAVPVIAASTDAAAQRLFTAPQQRFLRLIRGESLELLPPVDSMEPLWSDIEKAAVENRLGAAIVGSDATVQAGFEKLVNDTRADEVIVVTDTYEHSDRMDSYERVARIAAEIKLVPNVERRLK